MEVSRHLRHDPVQLCNVTLRPVLDVPILGPGAGALPPRQAHLRAPGLHPPSHGGLPVPRAPAAASHWGGGGGSTPPSGVSPRAACTRHPRARQVGGPGCDWRGSPARTANHAAMCPQMPNSHMRQQGSPGPALPGPEGAIPRPGPRRHGMGSTREAAMTRRLPVRTIGSGHRDGRSRGAIRHKRTIPSRPCKLRVNAPPACRLIQKAQIDGPDGVIIETSLHRLFR